MISINLLPWRDKLREERKRNFFAALAASGGMALCIVLVMHAIYVSKIDQQKDRNRILKEEVKILDQKIVEIKELKKIKEALLARMEIIQALQSNRPQVVHMFDELVKILPKGVFLTKVRRKGSVLKIEGKAESNTNVSELMRNITNSVWLASPVLTHIKTKKIDGKNESEFDVRCQLVNPNKRRSFLDVE